MHKVCKADQICKFLRLSICQVFPYFFHHLLFLLPSFSSRRGRDALPHTPHGSVFPSPAGTPRNAPSTWHQRCHVFLDRELRAGLRMTEVVTAPLRSASCRRRPTGGVASLQSP